MSLVGVVNALSSCVLANGTDETDRIRERLNDALNRMNLDINDPAVAETVDDKNAGNSFLLGLSAALNALASERWKLADLDTVIDALVSHPKKVDAIDPGLSCPKVQEAFWASALPEALAALNRPITIDEMEGIIEAFDQIAAMLDDDARLRTAYSGGVGAVIVERCSEGKMSLEELNELLRNDWDRIHELGMLAARCRDDGCETLSVYFSWEYRA